jgi:catechol 2,3-dioxygenase-like lactoylglutathione lyase family enzyme
MSRVQLALNVANLDEAIDFYTKLFRTEPAKIRDGYANFAIAEPPLKLVLVAGQGEPGTLNHLGVEVESTDEVARAITRLQSDGFTTAVEEQTTCCYATQDKVWVNDPSGAPWEVYTVLADADVMHPEDSTCCAPETVAAGLGCGVAETTNEPVGAAVSGSTCC